MTAGPTEVRENVLKARSMPFTNPDLDLDFYDYYKETCELFSKAVNTENEAGKSRLRKVAKQCVNYGVRVQNSVFECIVDGAQCRMLKGKLQEIIDEEKDSIRIYYLNDKQKQKIECLGVKKGISVENTLIF